MLQPLVQTFPNAKIVGICLADTNEPVARIPVNRSLREGSST
jgi:hypothetical protein